MTMYVGETEALNATHERWCRSKQPVALSPVYIDSILYLICLAKYLDEVKITLSTAKLSNTCANSFMYVLKARLDGGDPSMQGFAPNSIEVNTFACL
jgi:hypothetical protein